MFDLYTFHHLSNFNPTNMSAQEPVLSRKLVKTSGGREIAWGRLYGREIRSVLVAPTFRRRGYGTALLREMEEMARDFGYTEVFVRTDAREDLYRDRESDWGLVEHSVRKFLITNGYRPVEKEGVKGCFNVLRYMRLDLDTIMVKPLTTETTRRDKYEYIS